MREIKFRGKDIETGEWIYGGIDSTGECISVSMDKERYIAVDKETVSQYTGFNDVNNDEIYVGDILSDVLGNTVIVEYAKGAYSIKFPYCNDYMLLHDFLKVISLEKAGNIFDNR